jgi:hypothetical protein
MHSTLSHKTRLYNARARLDRLLDERTDDGELTQWVADVIHHFIDLAEARSEQYGSSSSALGAISGNTWLSPKEIVEVFLKGTHEVCSSGVLGLQQRYAAAVRPGSSY